MCKTIKQDIPNVRWLVPGEQGLYIHAKLFLIRRGETWDLYCGSMNLTEYAMDRNTEYMVHLNAPTSVAGIESFLAAFTGWEGNEITSALAQYDDVTSFFSDGDSGLFREAACIRASRITGSFSIVTVPDGLKKIDRMICDGIRTVVTGKTGKGKYSLSYQTIRAWGYRSLVNRYYRQLS